ncbi:unnamed protein product [Menidia menidia]|uniref:(Atlantic silverside) hypothetical protein n=1 Tax=Menidia menidia TaxID=238744 RepID=A0A8S4AZS2_9TELE|nr:unnamed protein product [Menidia menidia]
MSKKLSLKWFGSLTNLSSRKSKSRAASGPHGSPSSPCEASTAAGGQSLDDMEPRLHSPGYARSEDMYTHVGTVPRGEGRRKSRRGAKGQKAEEAGPRGGPGRPKAGEHVPDSPLLSALSSLSLTSMEPVSTRPLPSTPTPVRASPLTSAPGGDVGNAPDDPAARCQAPQRATKPHRRNTAASKQDVYVPMDPVSDPQTERQRGLACAPGTSRTSSPEEGSHDRCPVGTDGGGEYVKFSKEKCWLEPPSEKVKKQLEEELKLSGTDPKSQAWYHGLIPWEVSESLVVNQGDFLIRASQSSRGDFVLTSRWEQKTLHFPIRRVVLQSAELSPRVQYSLEGKQFDSLPALVHFYLGSRAALTQWSGAQIHQPVNRTLPLGQLEAAFSTGGEERLSLKSPSRLHHKGAEVCGEQRSPASTLAGETSNFTACSHSLTNTNVYNSLLLSAGISPRFGTQNDTKEHFLESYLQLKECSNYQKL